MTRCTYRKDIAYVPLVTVSNGVEQLEPNKKRQWSSAVNTFWIISAILIGLIYIFNFLELSSMMFNRIAELTEFPKLPETHNPLNGYLINTPGCRIPEMNPLDPSVKEFIFSPKKIICNKGVPPLFESNLTSLFIITEYLSLYNLTNITNLNCCYNEFWRQLPTENYPDTEVTYSEKCIPANATIVDINGEFIELICKDTENKTIYEDYFVFVPFKNETKRSAANNIKPNILILGLDAVSRVNFHRQLPNTYDYLTKELNAVELLGYNKVADNTFPNLIPVFTGMFEDELKKSCWPSWNTHFDSCPFLWTNFSENNYVTAFGEDCVPIGLFNYEKTGFNQQPTDYYYSAFIREMEYKTGDDKDFNCFQCTGGRETYKITLDYIRKFVTRMKLESAHYFGFFWDTSLSHDYLNRPALGDQNYNQLLRDLKENGHLENTILIFMSDHGIRWGGIRQTYQGQMEERLPFVFMALPKWFKENYPTAVANLNKNVRRLTTPFDLHETLKHLLDLNSLKNVRKIFNESVSRGYSLFNEIPVARTCEDAEIVSHWCTCQISTAITTNDTRVVNAAEFAVNNINSQLDGYAQCATLTLDSILTARVIHSDSEHITDKKSVKDYTVTIKTVPGEAVFEVTVRYKEGQPQVLTTIAPNRTRSAENRWSNFSITGTVSRLNLYGKQSYCITDFHLKLYCFCQSLINI